MVIRKLFLVFSLLINVPVFAETIAVIGTGNVGMALGTELAEQGHAIIYGSRSPSGLKALTLAKKTKNDATTATQKEAAASAKIVVLAVPGMVVEEVVNGLGDLSGKLIIDATNPLIMDNATQFSFGVQDLKPPRKTIRMLTPRGILKKAKIELFYDYCLRF